MFVEPVAMAALLVYCFGLVNRSQRNEQLQNCLMGLTFGLAAAYSLANSIETANGLIFDFRNLFIGVAAAFFSWIAGLIAVCIAAAMLAALGGEAVLIGILSMTFATALGLIWRWGLLQEGKNNFGLLAVLGVMLALPIYLAHLFSNAFQTFAVPEIAFVVAGMKIVGATLIGRLLQWEEDFTDHTQKLEYAAKMDPLTNLPNRRTLVESVADLSVKIEQPNGRAVIYLDIDHFKQVNDTHGHLVGDAVLKEFVRRIRNCLRPDDVFARIGGDEFAVVLPDIEESDARRAADRFCQAVAITPMWIDRVKIPVTVSMGVFWTDEAIGFDGLLMSADAELYHSKSKGRNRVSFKTGVAMPTAANVDCQDEQARPAAIVS